MEAFVSILIRKAFSNRTGYCYTATHMRTRKERMVALAPQMKTAFVILATVIVEVAIFLIMAPVASPLHLRTTDFLNFYVGASIVRRGDGAHLYSRETQDAEYESLVGYKSSQYFLHPPFEAVALAPLTTLPLKEAYLTWMMFNVALLGCLPLVLIPCVPFVHRRPYLLFLAFCFLPVVIALNTGQDSIILLFVFSLAFLLLSKGKDFLAGLVLSLVAIKFQYLVIVLPLLLCWRKVRLLGGTAFGGILLGLVSLLVTGPRGAVQYFDFVHTFDTHGGYGGLNPKVMVNARGFLAGIGYAERASTLGMWTGVLLVTATALWIVTHQREGMVDLYFALVMSIALVASPYAHFPDMTILVLPATLAINRLVTKAAKHPWLLASTSASLFVVPHLLLSRGRHYWWENDVYLLFVVILLFAGSLVLEMMDERTKRTA
jgi:Glycosyltransferase family 87